MWALEHIIYNSARVHEIPQAFLAYTAMTPAEIEAKTAAMIAQGSAEVASFIQQPSDTRTFANTLGWFDRWSHYSEVALLQTTVHLLSSVHPDAAVRDAASTAEGELQRWFVDAISMNSALYDLFRAYARDRAPYEQLSPEQSRYLAELLEGFERSGLGLPVEQRQRVAQLVKSLDTLSRAFARTIAESSPTIHVTADELAGLSPEFMSRLSRTDDGLYVVGIDYPTYFPVMDSCTVSATREKLWHTATQRAYPANEARLEEIRQQRHELAQLLGYPSYSHFNIANMMAKSPKQVHAFLDELSQRLVDAEKNEWRTWLAHLPEDVTLTEDGRIKPWDVGYVQETYKRQHYKLNEEEIAEYFPMDSTMRGLFAIYEQFFGIRFELVSQDESWHQYAWHKDVQLVAIYDRATDALQGYVFMDLHPRPGKYSHACAMQCIPAIRHQDGTRVPAVAVVIANFPRADKDKPALWHRTSAVQTFFHEFGHALHVVLSNTTLAGNAGYATKWDFVEMPSQILEEWLRDADILCMISSHYQTGAPLPDDLIARIAAVEQYGQAYATQRQIMLARLSLQLFDAPDGRSTRDIFMQLHRVMSVCTAWDDRNTFYTHFGHLMGYGARYYGYLWSKVFALDVFATVKQHGLLNPEIGKKYVHDILSRGGSDDPATLLYNFLGREPNQQAFLASLGITHS